MAEPLKLFFSKDLVTRLAGDIGKVHKPFDGRAFIRDANQGLEKLELLARGKHISAALARHLPKEYPEAVEILLRSLGPEHATDELLGVGMAPFFYLPHVLFVSEYGLGHFDVSMHAQYELTKRFSAEGSIRPFIQKEPERVFKLLGKWAKDKNAHVRRLVSEGTRLRLPWAMRVPWLDENPERVLVLLDLLKDDPTTVVRRSVANNLNDMSKVHPALLTKTCAAWLKNATEERQALVEHALRSAVKRGNKDALNLLGFGDTAKVRVEAVLFLPVKVKIGESVTFCFELRSTANETQDVLVDYRVHFVKASGKTSPKVFKLKRVQLAPKERLAFSSKISLAVHTTRKPQPGKHVVDVLVNGVALPAGAFHVVGSKGS